MAFIRPTPSFLRIPAELRVKIYEALFCDVKYETVFTHGADIVINKEFYSRTAMLAVNRQVRSEATPILEASLCVMVINAEHRVAKMSKLCLGTTKVIIPSNPTILLVCKNFLKNLRTVHIRNSFRADFTCKTWDEFASWSFAEDEIISRLTKLKPKVTEDTTPPESIDDDIEDSNEDRGLNLSMEELRLTMSHLKFETSYSVRGQLLLTSPESNVGLYVNYQLVVDMDQGAILSHTFHVPAARGLMKARDVIFLKEGLSWATVFNHKLRKSTIIWFDIWQGPGASPRRSTIRKKVNLEMNDTAISTRAIASAREAAERYKTKKQSARENHE